LLFYIYRTYIDTILEIGQLAGNPSWHKIRASKYNPQRLHERHPEIRGEDIVQTAMETGGINLNLYSFSSTAGIVRLTAKEREEKRTISFV
jgi:hypothetical protein